MRKISSIALIIFTVAGFAMAQSGDAPLWVSGEVASIFEDQSGGLISLKLADGERYNISVTRDQLKEIQVGDNITVEIYRGWAELIEKEGAEIKESPKAEKEKNGPQWIAGNLYAIEQGPENSLLSVKLSNKKIFNVSAPNDMVSGLKIGDYITVKIERGWAQSVTKN